MGVSVRQSRLEKPKMREAARSGELGNKQLKFVIRSVALEVINNTGVGQIFLFAMTDLSV